MRCREITDLTKTRNGITKLIMKRTFYLLGLTVFLSSGCSSIVESMLDSAFDSSSDDNFKDDRTKFYSRKGQSCKKAKRNAHYDDYKRENFGSHKAF